MLKLMNYLILFFVLGLFFSLLIAFGYANSANYCRDCNTGLGLCMIGYFLSIPATFAIAYVNTLISSKWKSDKRKRKRE
jgi:hypothetical protein